MRNQPWDSGGLFLKLAYSPTTAAAIRKRDCRGGGGTIRIYIRISAPWASSIFSSTSHILAPSSLCEASSRRILSLYLLLFPVWQSARHARAACRARERAGVCPYSVKEGARSRWGSRPVSARARSVYFAHSVLFQPAPLKRNEMSRKAAREGRRRRLWRECI